MEQCLCPHRLLNNPSPLHTSEEMPCNDSSKMKALGCSRKLVGWTVTSLRHQKSSCCFSRGTAKYFGAEDDRKRQKTLMALGKSQDSQSKTIQEGVPNDGVGWIQRWLPRFMLPGVYVLYNQGWICESDGLSFPRLSYLPIYFDLIKREITLLCLT